MSAAARVMAIDDAMADRCADRVLDVVPQVMDAVRQAMRRHVGGQLSIPQFRCLNHIGRHPGASIGSVAVFLGVTMPTASAMVDRLIRAGSVSTRVSATDRRRLELELTPLGRGLLDQIRRDAQVEIAEWLRACPLGELSRLEDGLGVLASLFPPSDAGPVAGRPA